MQSIKCHSQLLAVYGNCSEIEPGRFFWGDGVEAIQWGTYNLKEGEKTPPHIHKLRERVLHSKTIEMFVMLAGVMRADIYDNDKKIVAMVAMEPGSWLCTYDGGHGFEILQDGTKFLEVKLGPFTTPDEDKERF